MKQKGLRRLGLGATAVLIAVLSTVIAIVVSGTPVYGCESVIHGTVVNDVNGNGVQDADEVGIAGVSVGLSGDATLSTTTSASGFYLFDKLTPGSYIVTETDLAGYISTTPNEVYLVTVAGSVYQVNFGDIFPPVPPDTAYILGTVFYDNDGNGQRSLGETGILGVTISLDGTVSTTTNQYGEYSFKVTSAGQHTATEADPQGYYSTTPNTVVCQVGLGNFYQVDFGDSSLATCSLSLTPELAYNQLPDDTTETYTITLRDQHGNGLSGQRVDLSTTFGSLSVTSVITGANGMATFSISSTLSGTATITAVAGPLSDTATKHWLSLSPPPPPPTTTPTTTAQEQYFVVDFLGKITTGLLSSEGRLLDSLEASSPDGAHLLRLEKGTRTLDSKGMLVTKITIREAAEVPQPSSSAIIVGSAYEFMPSGIIFDNSARLTLGYDINKLPEQVASIALAYCTPDSSWTEIETESGVVAGIGKMTAPVDHFTIFAILARPTDAASAILAGPTDAAFRASSLVVTPLQEKFWRIFPLVVRTGTEVNICADLNNYGGQQGVYNVVLKVDGETRGQKALVLNPLQTERATFTLTGNQPGRHTVQIEDLSAEFITSLSINWWLILVLLLPLGVSGWLVKKYVLR